MAHTETLNAAGKRVGKFAAALDRTFNRLLTGRLKHGLVYIGGKKRFQALTYEDVMDLEKRNSIRRQLGLPEYTEEPFALGGVPPHLKEENDSLDPAQRAYDNTLSLGGTKEEAERAYDQVRRSIKHGKITK